jgi:16S rRNA (guanine966-N2)-methyltransferase
MNQRGRGSRPRRAGTNSTRPHASETTAEPSRLRIIGGSLRGRPLAYSGDARTRPMKDRVREAVFNLVGPAVRGKVALDLFAGTGALGLEAISRGARSAVFIERHVPTARLIETNANNLGITPQVRVYASDTFFWLDHDWQPGPEPLLIFCSPPYDLYVQDSERMRGLLETVIRRAPPGSIVVVEADERFDFRSLPAAPRWRIREYPPAVVAVGELPEAGNDSLGGVTD